MSRPRVKGEFPRWVTRPAAVLLVWMAGGGAGLAQPDHGLPGVPPVVLPGGQVPSSAVIDTAVAVFDIPAEIPAPVAVHTVGDSLYIGDVFHVVLDYSEAVSGDLTLEPAAGAEWLAPVPVPKPGLIARILGQGPGPRLDTDDLPEVGPGARSLHPFRVFRTHPFRIQVGSFLSPVIHVQGRLEASDQAAAIRGPRPVGWSVWLVLILIVFLILILLLARWLWQWTSKKEELADRHLPAPAWLAAAVDLRDLLQGGLLQRGDNRAFLDGLAGITRRFVAGRYRIGAQDMTGREIIAACTDLGHRSTQPSVFARLIDDMDRRRYDPEKPEVAWCRDQAVQFFDRLAEVRILPRFTAVDGKLRRQGDLAWAGLERELSSGPSRLQGTPAVNPEQKT